MALFWNGEKTKLLDHCIWLLHKAAWLSQCSQAALLVGSQVERKAEIFSEGGTRFSR